jgi:hypothetical protein
MATVSTVAIVGSVAYGAYTQQKAGKAAQELSNFNAAQTELESRARAQDAQLQSLAVRTQNEQLQARQRALYAKAGVVGTTGTPLLVLADQAAILEMGALDVERTGSLEAARLKQQSVIQRWQGNIARQTGNTNAMGTILQGVSSLASSYGHYRGIA